MMIRAARIAAAFAVIAGLSTSAVAADDLAACKSISRDPSAVEACTRVISSRTTKREDLSSAYYERGLKHRWHRRSDQAISDFTKSLELDPKRTWAYVARGHAFADKKNFERAFADQETAIRLESSAVTYTGRAIDLIAAGAYDRAIADLDEALRRDSKYFYGHLNRGKAYLKKRDFAQALVNYQKALELRPDDTEAQRGVKRARDRVVD